MNVASVIAQILKREGVEFLIGYPVKPSIEAAAEADIRTILVREEVKDVRAYTKAPRLRSGPDPRNVSDVAAALVAAERPVIYAGQGVHYARAWKQLRDLAELLESPVTTSLPGKSAFPENHPLSLGSGGRSISQQLHHFLTNSDLIFGIGCSFATTNYGVAMPKGKR